MIYRLLDIFFVVFHTFLIFFNLLGWIFKKTRKLNLIVLILTGSSWLLLGLLVGTLGYCPLTDWHFTILYKLGENDLPVSYIKYLADRLTGIDFSSSTIDSLTLWIYLIVTGFSFYLNLRDRYRVRKNVNSTDLSHQNAKTIDDDTC